jgi:hypothetical protein
VKAGRRATASGAARWVVLAAGLALVGFGIVGFLGEPYLAGNRVGVLIWGAAGIVLHDGVWMPVVLLAGAVVARFVPARVRGPVVIGLITAAALTAVGLPAVLREDQHNGNATLLPLAYLRNWLLLLAGVAVAVAVGAVAVAAGSARRRRRSPTPLAADPRAGDGDGPVTGGPSEGRGGAGAGGVS